MIALDVSARIEQLGSLRDGWHDGTGVAPSRDGLRWFATAWEAHWPVDAPLPRLYPTPKGGVQAEWTIKQLALSVEVDLSTKWGALLEVNADSGKITFDQDVDLALGEGWQSIARRIKSL